MASITIDIPNAGDTTRALDAFAATFGYTGPETKAAFAKAQVAKWIKNIVSQYESQQAAEAARQAAITSANGLNIS